MILTGMTIENFKGIGKPVHVDFKPVTLLFGPNSAGKSTIVQALHYAREVFERRNVNSDTTIAGGKSLNLGGFKNVVHKHDVNKTISLSFNLNLEDIDLSDWFNFNYEFLLKFQENSMDHFPNVAEYIKEQYVLTDDVLSKINKALIKINIEWNFNIEQPEIKNYEIHINGKIISRINSYQAGKNVSVDIYFHPIFFSLEMFQTDEYYKYVDWDLEEEHFTDYQYPYDSIDPHEDWTDSYDDKEPSFFEDDNPESSDSWHDLNENRIEKGNVHRRNSKRQSNYEKAIFLSFVINQKTALPDWDEFLLPADDSEDLDRDLLINIINGIVVAPGRVLLDCLQKFSYIGPLREIPPRNYTPVLSPDKSRWSSGLAAWDTLHGKDDFFFKKLNRWLAGKKHLNTGYQIKLKKFIEIDPEKNIPEEVAKHVLNDNHNTVFSESLLSEVGVNSTIFNVNKRLVLQDMANDIEVYPQDIGVGISQILPVVVRALTSRDSIVAIEQPELHIHPALQVALGDLFISQANENDALFLIETHSEHLLLRLLRRIRETTDDELPEDAGGFSSTQLAVNFIENKGSGVILTTICINEDGDFENHWPQGFFKERARELF